MGLGVNDPFAVLSRWVADERVDRAAADRARQRWLERQAGEESTLAGILLDLAERQGPVLIGTAATTLRGPVIALAADFVVIHAPPSGDSLVPLRSIATVTTGPDTPAPVGDRPVPVDATMAALLLELAAEQPTVSVTTTPANLRGTLVGGGRDVITVRTGDSPARLVHVASRSIDHLTIVAR